MTLINSLESSCLRDWHKYMMSFHQILESNMIVHTFLHGWLIVMPKYQSHCQEKICWSLGAVKCIVWAKFHSKPLKIASWMRWEIVFCILLELVFMLCLSFLSASSWGIWRVSVWLSLCTEIWCSFSLTSLQSLTGTGVVSAMSDTSATSKSEASSYVMDLEGSWVSWLSEIAWSEF